MVGNQLVFGTCIWDGVVVVVMVAQRLAAASSISLEMGPSQYWAGHHWLGNAKYA